MDTITLLQVFLFGIALSMDAFAVAVTDGLIYEDINKKKSLFIGGMFGLFQAIMPLIGFWFVEGITRIVDEAAGEKAGNILSTIVSWLSFILLLFIGTKMLIEAIKDIKNTEEEKKPKLFSFKEVFIMAIATAIDALATGVAFHSGLSNTSTIWLHALIIMCCTFLISEIGLILARQIHKLLKGKFEITSIIGGIILITLGFWVILSHYFGS